MNTKIMAQFRNPGASFRGAPFWAWNAKMDRRELVRQVAEFKRGGFGGFFIHVRYGLETEYLSDEFMDCVKAVVAEAKRLGLEAWLYDEDRWASGFAGGLATRDHANRAKSLVWDVVPDGKFRKLPAGAIACFSARLDGENAYDVRPLREGQRPGKGRHALIYQMCTGQDTPWFNHASYLDVMSPSAVRAFIKSTHEAYKKVVGHEFGKTIPGIFTDEPNYNSFCLHDRPAARALPWTGRFADEFKRRMGYDVRSRLVEVSHRVDGKRFSEVRRDYRQVATELYVEAYSKQIGQWCAKNNLQLTGHELCESLLESQTSAVGACMQHFEWFQRPGIDILTDKTPELLNIKQAVSAAGQFGRNRLLSELYGCTGWDSTFEMYKHVGDWHQVLGINHFCPHLSWYSMAGGAKRDYPASIFFQSPWWSDHKLLGDYFGRLSAVLSQGQAVREVCVIHPIESAWGMQLKTNPWLVSGYTDITYHLMHKLLDSQLDFDLADEELLRKIGSVRKVRGVPRLDVGKMSYRAVVVPESVTLRGTTVAMLERFRRTGGKLMFAGKPPELVDGKPSSKLKALVAESASATISDAALKALLGDECRPVIVEKLSGYWHLSAPRTWIHLRKAGDDEFLFVINMDRTRPDSVRVRWLGEGRVRELVAVNGDMLDVTGVESGGGRQSFAVELPPTGSRLFVRTHGRSKTMPASKPAVEVSRIALAPEWDYSLDEPNGLTLDYARMRVLGTNDGTPVARRGVWREGKLLWQHEADLRQELGFPKNTEPAEQPFVWMKNLLPRSAAVELEFDVLVDRAPDGRVNLVMEHPERFEISLNGNKVDNKACGWFIDTSFRVVPVGKRKLHKGVNKLWLKTEYRQHHWMEDVYLTGSFGVRNAGEKLYVTSLPERLKVGDWVGQGLAMYSGAVTYRQTVRIGKLAAGQRAVLCLQNPKATVVRVAVNGKKVATIGWQPWEVDITDSIKPCRANVVEITLVSSRRNLLGPLHFMKTGSYWTGPAEFRPGAETLSHAHQFVQYGLMGEAYVAVREMDGMLE